MSESSQQPLQVLLRNKQWIQEVLRSEPALFTDSDCDALVKLFQHFIGEDFNATFTDRDATDYILSWKNDFTDDRHAQINEIAETFDLTATEIRGKPPKKRPASGRVGEGNHNKRQQTGRGKGEESIRHPWRAVMRLEVYRLPADILHHFSTFGTDGNALLSDTGGLLCQIGRFASQENLLGDAFLACYTYAVRVQAGVDIYGIRWCFSMLMTYDLVKIICRTSTGRRLGTNMKSKIRQALEPVILDTDFSLDTVCAHLDDWSNLGWKINFICERMEGEGCLLYLPGVLTKDFLENKFTASGPYFEEAIAHLKQLREKEAAPILEKAQRLGQSMRSKLIEPFAAIRSTDRR